MTEERLVEAHYSFPASLIHRLLIGIVSLVVALAGFTVAWIVIDSGWKARIDEKLIGIQADQAKVAALVADGVLPVAKTQIRALEARVSRLEKDNK